MNHNQRVCHSPALGGLLCLLLAMTPAFCAGQPAPAPPAAQPMPAPSAQTVSQSGLLPVFGVDFHFDPSWVDGAAFPATPADFPNSGVNTSFQNVWDRLKAGGYGAIRFPLDVHDPQAAANRLANLCVWGKANQVRLIPVFTSPDATQPIADGFGMSAGDIAGKTIELVRKGSQADVYGQILAYQIEFEPNHAGRHGGAAVPSDRIVKAADTLRTAEAGALKGSGIDPSPIMVDVSFDFALIGARAMAGQPLTPDKYAQAVSTLKTSLADFAASPNIDIVAVEWLAGSVSAGGPDRFPALLSDVVSTAPGKQVVLATGFSTAFRTSDEQNQFYQDAFLNAARFRAGAPADGPFVGLLFHEAIGGADTNPPPPTPGLPDEVKQWDLSARADELMQIWTGKGSSEPVAWWLKKVEANMGLVVTAQDASGAQSLTVQPAQDRVAQIAAGVSDAAGSASDVLSQAPAAGTGTPSDDPSAPRAEGPGSGGGLPDQLQQALLVLLQKLIDRIGGPSVSGGSGQPAADPSLGSAGAAPLAPGDTAPTGAGPMPTDGSSSAPAQGAQPGTMPPMPVQGAQPGAMPPAPATGDAGTGPPLSLSGGLIQIQRPILKLTPRLPILPKPVSGRATLPGRSMRPLLPPQFTIGKLRIPARPLPIRAISPIGAPAAPGLTRSATPIRPILKSLSPSTRVTGNIELPDLSNGSPRREYLNTISEAQKRADERAEAEKARANGAPPKGQPDKAQTEGARIEKGHAEKGKTAKHPAAGSGAARTPVRKIKPTRKAPAEPVKPASAEPGKSP
jgi:hypothetical protein